MSSNIQGKGPIVNPGLCRCCGALKRCRILNVEYSWQGRKEVYSEMFVDCFGLVLSHLEGEETSCLICATCVTRLRDASLFRQQVLQNEEKLLTSYIQIHEDVKIKKIKQEETIKTELEFSDDGKADEEDTRMSDNECDVTEPIKPTQMEVTSEGTNLVLPEKKLIQAINSKRSNINMSDVKQVDLQKLPDTIKPPVGIHTIINNFIKSNVVRDRSFRNAVTIVENSYACPFRAIYNTYHCIYCTKKFIEPDQLREHTMNHNPKAYKEILKNIRQRNNKCYIDLQRIDCRLCDEKIDDFKTFQTHISKVHSKKLFTKTSDNDDDFIILMFILTYTNLKCMECEKIFPDLHSLKLHMADHFGKCVCDVCGMHYFEDSNLKAHLKSHKPTEASFTCTQCGKTFRSKYNMNIHTARVHTKESPYFCNICDESFFSNTLRHRHMVDVHNEEFMFKCKSCDKVYNNRKQLVQHNRRSHLKIFKHGCPVCEKRFCSPAYLREHMYSHTGERNYRCEHCGKSYPRMKALKVHLQSHSAEKKYKCSLCNASYSQNVCLKNHVKRQHHTISADKTEEVIA